MRARIVSHLRHVDEQLAADVAAGLGLDLPEPFEAAVAPRTDLPASDALSILKNGPSSFAGRKLGILTCDGADAEVLNAVQQAVTDARGTVEVIAPTVGGVTLSDGSHLPAQQRVEGGPSVLYDAVALLPGDDCADDLARKASAKDFVSDAYAHQKFIGHLPAAAPLLAAAGVDAVDDGFVDLSATDADAFVAKLAALRFWERDVTA